MQTIVGIPVSNQRLRFGDFSEWCEGKRRLPAGIPGETSGTVLVGENVALQRRAHTRESPRHCERQYNNTA